MTFQTRKNHHSRSNGRPNQHTQKAFDMLEAARPKNGDVPETSDEWQKLLAASEALSTSMYLDMGVSEKEARGIAKAIHGGEGGMMLLRLSFKEHGDD